MPEAVKLIECPRDAWQGLKGQIPTDLKVNYLQALISAGFKHIDAVSFVSPNAVPQMADSEDVLKELDPPDDVEIIGIVVNEKGAQRAIKTEAVRTVGFPYSISPTFLQNNQRQTLEDAIEELEKIEKKADEAGMSTVVYISMAFGNPYGDPWTRRGSRRSRRPARGPGDSHDLARRYGGPRLARSNSRSRLGGDGEVSTIWKSASTCTADPTTPPPKFSPPTTPDAAASTRPWAASEDAPLRRTIWSAISLRRK